jgi:hypothetical protein
LRLSQKRGRDANVEKIIIAADFSDINIGHRRMQSPKNDNDSCYLTHDNYHNCDYHAWHIIGIAEYSVYAGAGTNRPDRE